MRPRPLILLAILFLAMPIVFESLAANSERGPISDRDVQAEPASEVNRAAGFSLITLSEAQAERLSPLNRDIRDLLIQEMAEVVRLTTQLKTLQDPIAALDLQRQISALKAGTQIAILEAQGSFARQEGHIERADEIDAAVALMKSRQEARMAKREVR